MKTCTTRLTLERYVPKAYQSVYRVSLFLMLVALSSNYTKGQCPIPTLECQTRVISCADPAAQLTSNAGYFPMIIDDCGQMNLTLTSIPWPEATEPCEGSFSHVIFRKWQTPSLPGQILCIDTLNIVRVNILSDSLICPDGRDTILCGIDPNPIDSLSLRAPMYEIENVDTFALVPGVGEFCGLSISVSDTAWSMCGNTKTITRQWNIHDNCGNEVICYDTLVLIDTVAPIATFLDPDLDMEPHTFADFSGVYLTDTIGMSSVGCVGHGLLPYATVTDNCSDPSQVSVHISSSASGYYSTYQADEVKSLSAWNVVPEKEFFVYRYTDECHNESFDTVVIVVADLTPAVAACHDAVNLSLTNVDLFTFMKAGSLDAESYDNCFVYEILARRTDWSTACGYQEGIPSPIGDFYDNFADWVATDGGICQDIYEYGFAREVPFCCADVGQAIMVEIMVIDNNCNVDKCWGMVYVEDKLAPQVLDPLVDVNITCNAYDQFYQSIFENGDTAAIQAAFGVYALDVFSQGTWDLKDLSCDINGTETITNHNDGLISDNCGSNLKERYTLPESGCVGTQVKREFIAILSGDHGTADQVYATQYINITKCPLDLLNLSLPVVDTTIYACGVTFGLDGNVTIATPGPNLPTNLPDCSQYGIGFFDKVFSVVSGPACNKVLRTWCVVDWCEVSLSAGSDWTAISHLPGVKTFNQYIKVMDTVPPSINVLSMLADIQTVNCTGVFSSEILADDQCGVEPAVEWFLKNQSGVIVDMGTGTIAEPEEPLLPGDYKLLWRATDACNNTAEQLSNFSINSDAAPSVVGYSALTAVLTPMDTNNNGSVDIGMAEVWAKEFNSSSLPPCGGDLENIVYLIALGTAGPDSIVPPNTATSLTFTCDDFSGNQTLVNVQFWVKDTVANTADYANVIVLLEDNSGVCTGGGTSPTVGVSGKIYTVMKEEIADVKVKASDREKETLVTTSDNGVYHLGSMQGDHLRVVPLKEDAYDNGVSTVDLLKIQRHILGIRSISEPFKLIAADANNDQKINPIDLIQLRKILLGKLKRLPDNEAWRFVDAAYGFEGKGDPLTQDFPEYIEVTSGTNTASLDFVGVKIGDLDDNAVARRSARAVDESALLTITDQYFKAGEMISVPFYLMETEMLYGLQLSLGSDPASLEFAAIESGILTLNDQMTHQLTGAEDKLNISWSEPYAINMERGEPLFTITYRVKKDGRLSDLIHLNQFEMKSLMVIDGDQVKGLKIIFSSQTTDFVLGQNWPNPFREVTDIDFVLPHAGRASLRVFDTSGRLIKEVSGPFDRGLNQISLDRSDLRAGMLYYELRTDYGTKTKRMMLLE